MLDACRYFGSTPEHWWATLTWPRWAKMQERLAVDPPADRLLQLYFIAQKWWSPPDFGAPRDEPEVWESPYPDVTE